MLKAICMSINAKTKITPYICAFVHRASLVPTFDGKHVLLQIHLTSRKFPGKISIVDAETRLFSGELPLVDMLVNATDAVLNIPAGERNTAWIS